MRRGGDSYYVLVNKDDEVYEINDIADTYTAEFDSWEEAEDQLQYLIEEEELDADDGWHVERWRW
jgi:hypothetical protein